MQGAPTVQEARRAKLDRSEPQPASGDVFTAAC
jgi:hypothetical protein